MNVIPFPLARREDAPFVRVPILASSTMECTAWGFRILADDMKAAGIPDEFRARLLAGVDLLETRAAEVDARFGAYDTTGAA